MRLLNLMYHRARTGAHGNSPECLDAHFAEIAKAYACVLPGDALERERLNVCITFDDAYYDFYAVVFPLLKKHGLRALLAVPVVVLKESTDANSELRLSSSSDVLNFEDPRNSMFCTWPELLEMSESGHVAVAAHGFTHCRLDVENVDLDKEVSRPQSVLSARLGKPVESFVFPYGRFSRVALERVRKTYRYAFRIGSADNPGWSQLLYRVDADAMRSPDDLFSPSRRAGYRIRYWWNRLRGR